MAYSSKKGVVRNSVLRKGVIKCGKMLAQYFPLNCVRIFGLRLCGFKIGAKVYVGPDLIIASIISEKGCDLKLGDRVAIGPRVTIVLSSDANWSNLMMQINPVVSSITLEDDCWIGAGAILLPGITVGKGAIVGAGSVVTKDVPAFEVFVGNPAKFLKEIKPF